MSSKNKIFRILMLMGFIALGLFIYEHFLDIRPSNVIENLAYQSEWDLPSPNENQKAEIDGILSRPFTYQSEGGQSYVFSSQDNRYVLKLFKYKRFRPAWYANLIPDVYPFNKFKEQHVSKRAKKLMTVFMGHKVAYENIKDESALIFVQLNPSHISQVVSITDKLGFSHQVDLGEAAFVIQKKGEMLRRNFSKLISEGKIDVVKERIRKVFAVFVSEYQKGIYDDDHGVMQNFGFIGEQPFHLDVGKFKISQEYIKPEVYQKDLVKIAERMRIWMRKYYPDHYEEIKQSIEGQLSQIFGTPFTFSTP